ncbi:MAG: immune inhibitor A [Anaerolineaceae bacterium]|nr:immune inhibitor A [Anaerolineaceae bacterium]
MNKTIIVVLIVIGLVLCCCMTVVVLLSGGLIALGTINIIDSDLTIENENIEVIRDFDNQDAFETLNNLKNTSIPENDLVDLAYRFKGLQHIPEVAAEEPVEYSIGDEKQFWITDMDTDENFQVTTQLAAETAHAYFWVEEGLKFDLDDLESMAQVFEEEIYPVNRAFFGSEWSPGIDSDEHIFILYVTGAGNSIAGYFSSIDSVHPLANEYSNAHETFVFNADTVDLDENFTYGVLAHEFQHMIHWNQDRNETTWLNEGFAELAAYLNGFDPGGMDYYYLVDPDRQLNTWPDDSDETLAHYGSAFLFVTYFLERFGEQATQALVSNASNGLESVDSVLSELGLMDYQTGALITADELFADWVVSNYLQDASIGDGRYAYSTYSDAATMEAYQTENIDECSNEWFVRSVNQYGVDYIGISCSGTYELQFEGSTEVNVIPTTAYSGDFMYWSNRSDESDMTLTREFDFSDVSGKIELSYWTWFDIEEGYDFSYLSVSRNGEEWEIIKTPSSTQEDYSGSSYGWGYSGKQQEWVLEEVDLSAYAGEKVQIRFEYVTDAALHGEGLVLDDISIPAIGYFDDFEEEEPHWQAEGFTRIQSWVPQTYELRVIEFGSNSNVNVNHFNLDGRQSGNFSFEVGEAYSQIVLVVSGTSRFSRTPSGYQFRFIEK